MLSRLLCGYRFTTAIVLSVSLHSLYRLCVKNSVFYRSAFAANLRVMSARPMNGAGPSRGRTDSQGSFVSLDGGEAEEVNDFSSRFYPLLDKNAIGQISVSADRCEHATVALRFLYLRSQKFFVHSAFTFHAKSFVHFNKR